MDWTNRSMSPREFERSALALTRSRAAYGRFLGVSERTMHRYLDGSANIPVAIVLLTRWLLAEGISPTTPPRKRKRAVVAEHPTPTSA